MSEKSVQEVSKQTRRSFPKTDRRYWHEKVFKNTYRRAGEAFETPHYYVKIQFRGRRENFPLGTPNRASAATAARDIYLSLHAQGWDQTLEIFKPGVVPVDEEVSPTVGRFIEEAVAVSTARPVTLDAYTKALRKIVADMFKIRPRKKYDGKAGGATAWREEVDSIRLERLTPERIQKWKVTFLRLAGTDPAAKRRATVTCNSLIRNAKALFSKKHIHFIRAQIELPTPLPFDGVPLDKQPSMRYQSKIDVKAIIEAAQDELLSPALGEARWSRAQQFKILTLAMCCGLRKSEIDALLWSAFDFEKRILRVENSEFHTLKSEDSAGAVDLDDEVALLFEELSQNSTGLFVVESNNPPRCLDSTRHYRCTPHFVALCSWLRAQGVEARKPLHELRKEFGSLVCSRQGVYAASRALRHGDIRITSQVYLDKKDRISAGLGSLLKQPQS